MRVKELTIGGLFGAKFHLEFNEDVTFLYGMNGCGKTTILNILSYITGGNLFSLHRYRFEYLELLAQEGEQNNRLVIHREQGNVSPLYVVEYNGETAKVPLPQVVQRMLREEQIDDETEVDIEYPEEDLTSSGDSAVSSIRSTLRKQFRPVYLPLSRRDTPSGSATMSSSAAASARMRSRTSEHLDLSLRRASLMVRNFSSSVTHRENVILERLKEDVLKKALLTPDLTPTDLRRDIYLEEKSRGDAISAVSSFDPDAGRNYTVLADRITELQDSFCLGSDGEIQIRDQLAFANYVSAISQLRRFYEVAHLVTRASKRRQAIRRPLNTLLLAINQFLADNEKEIFIEESSGTPLMRFKGRQQEIPVSRMSSGEKQLLISFIYITLGLEDQTGIFIMDEPELSLHMSWQRKLVPNLMKVAPGVQFVFATHSPDIIGRMTKKCVEVRGN